MNAILPRNPDAPPLGTPALARAVLAHFAHSAGAPGADDPLKAAAARWPRDEATAAIIRASTSPATSGTHPALAAIAVADFLGALPLSAASRILREAVTVNVGRASQVLVPYDAADPTTGLSWVGEGDPVPVSEGVVDTADLGVKKLGVILVVSRQLAKMAGAEPLLRAMLERRAARAFDNALFATTAGSSTAHAGILNGLTPLTGFAGGDAAAIQADLKGLAVALASAGGSGRILLVVHPTQAATLALAMPQLSWPVVQSPAIPAGRVVAIDPAGVTFGTNGTVDIFASNTGLVHMASDPAEIVTDAGAVADPVRELWQTDAIAMRLIVDLAFAARPGAVQYLTGATW